MAKSDITVAVTAKMEIPEETARRCLTLLEFYLEDHSDIEICCDTLLTGDGESRALYFGKRRKA